jgi:NDP-sugar pyrophosphorylase family protein
MILAGGLSTRLYPLTKRVPKPLVPIAGVPNAAHLLHYLKAYGFDQIVMNLHYRAEAIVAVLGDGSRFGVEIHYSHEPELLGSAGAVKNVQSYFGDETFLVIGCDELTDLRLDRLLEFHRDRDALASIALIECEDVEQYGVVVLDESGRIVGFQEKPPRGTERSKLVNTGVYVFSPGIFEHIPAAEFYDFGKQVFPSLQAANERFYGFDARGAYWADIGTPSEYRRASYDVVTGAVRIPQTSASGIDPSATIGAGTHIEGPVRLGPGVTVGDGVQIEGPCILDDRVRVESGARLKRAIVWQGATIGARAEVVDAVVGNDTGVAPGSILRDTLVAVE